MTWKMDCADWYQSESTRTHFSLTLLVTQSTKFCLGQLAEKASSGADAASGDRHQGYASNEKKSEETDVLEDAWAVNITIS